MAGLGEAASIIAVLGLSAKVTLRCIEYSTAVKDANVDITRLKSAVKSLEDVLRKVEQLLNGPDGAKLSTSQKLLKALNDCFLQLEDLDKKLEPGKTRKAMSRFAARALKWPFESKKVDKVVKELESYKQTISLAVQVDQTVIVLDMDRKIDLAKLPSAEGAAFDSYHDALDARCHPETRLDLLRRIREWVQDPQGRCLFWLNGMAGTGKSTISRTLAQSFADENQLGASFFFKRGEGDRGNAAKLFTTIAAQLVAKMPELAPNMRKAIEADPAISTKAIKEQFEKLIFQPLSEVKRLSPQISKLVIVVDALDECEREGDIKTILYLLSQTRHVRSICMRVFVTSRPELPTRLGFREMPTDAHHDLVLHDIPKEIIDHDISAYLKDEFAKIRDDKALPLDWPGARNIQVLVEMATPLFIFAATVCRFVGDSRWDPKKQLASVLKYHTISQASKLDKTYLPVLDQLLVGLTSLEKKELIQEFRVIVGSIVILAEPLSTASLVSLLDTSQETVDCRLGLLHSVLSVPATQDAPVRLLHLSFRDFLLDSEKRGKNPFWVDERETHEMMATKCLDLLSRPECLEENICSLDTPGKLRAEINRQIIENRLPAHIRYACRYWVYHFEHSRSSIRDQGQVHRFLQKHFLHWLEALSLIGKTSEVIAFITTLQTLVAAGESTRVSAFLSDARRFVLKNRLMVDTAPLQLYSSSIFFAPETSIVRNTFKDRIPSWICRLSKAESTWSAVLQTLEGHSGAVSSVAFSADGKLIASGSADQTVKLWDAATGALQQTLEGHSGGVMSVAFSADGKLIASGSADRTVKLWDAATGALQQTLEGHSDQVFSVAFSADGKLIASGSIRTVNLWDAATGALQQTLEGHSDGVKSVAFSADGKLIASGSYDRTVNLWDAATGALQQTLEDHSGGVESVAFSADGKLIASGSYQTGDAATGALQQTLEGHSDGVNSVAFSADGKLIVSGSSDGTVKLWDAATGALQQTLEGHSGGVMSVAFSADGKLIASGSIRTVNLWDAATGALQQTLKGHRAGAVTLVAFSADGKLIASGSADRTVKLWDAATGALQQTLEGHSNEVNSVAFTADGKLIASGWDDQTVKLLDAAKGALQQTLKGHLDRVKSVAFSADGKLIALDSYQTVKLWDAATGALQQTLEGHSDGVNSVAFSADGKLIASGSSDGTVKLWDAATGALQQTLKGHSAWVFSVAFSADGKLIASGSYDRTVKLWDAATGALQQTLEGHSDGVKSVAFSADGKLIASGSYDRTVNLWDAATGALQQTLKGHSGVVKSVAFSADGKLIASGSYDRTVKLWDAATGALQQTLEGHSGGINSVAFSADGKLIASGWDDQTVKLWDAATGALQQTLEGHSDGVFSVAFSADGKLIASGSSDRTVKLWDAATGALQQTLEDVGIITELSFSKDGLYLETNRGLLRIQSTHNGMFPLKLERVCDIYVKEQWVGRDMENLLWLPPEYRAACWSF
ncbi:MAG: hypothetical protein M1816_000367 [Peltula sp. TS41687]|nr:MAG: hypothetical protein M1816_000367 [Peltula sp. TS41687]